MVCREVTVFLTSDEEGFAEAADDPTVVPIKHERVSE